MYILYAYQSLSSISNAENCSGFPPPTRQTASIGAELLGLTSIYSEFVSNVSLHVSVLVGRHLMIIIFVICEPCPFWGF